MKPMNALSVAELFLRQFLELPQCSGTPWRDGPFRNLTTGGWTKTAPPWESLSSHAARAGRRAGKFEADQALGENHVF